MGNGIRPSGFFRPESLRRNILHGTAVARYTQHNRRLRTDGLAPDHPVAFVQVQRSMCQGARQSHSKAPRYKLTEAFATFVVL